ncbi:hypothetical protein HZC20_02105 [Candidatus Peregrinibacteria bacterium]|nr:hypothetical protein [Candidatus Peregrinibacteria bacterium]
MKKILAKSALFTIITVAISLNLSIFSAKTASAGTAEELGTALKDVEDDQCVKIHEDDESANTDAGYIVTVLEEPLNPEQSSPETGDEKFKSRICYRNTFSFTGSDNKQTTLTEVSLKCSQTAEALVANSAYTQYHPYFDCQMIQVLLSKGGTALIEGYVSTIYKWGASVAGIIAVIVIIVSGIQISVSGGDSQAVESAKNRITQSIGGLIILFLSALILYTANPNFFTAS